MATPGHSTDVPTLVALIKTLTNPLLKELLRSESLQVSGVKIALQLRIIQRLEEVATSDRLSFDALARRILDAALPKSRFQPHDSNQYPAPPITQSPAQARSTTLGVSMSPHPYTAGPGSSLAKPPAPHRPPGRLEFKESPFFTILEALTPVVECKIREQTRDSVELKVMLSQRTAQKLQMDTNARVMVYCAADSGLTQYTKSDIAFPHQVELKANLDEVKANLRGLKNRPGTTQPADVTNYIRKKPDYPNNIVMTYALTQKKFFALANLVKQHPIEDLVSQLKTRKLISKEQVIREMKNRAHDSDIVATSSVMSLKCPLSTLRIQVPCRSIQAPTWTCPVCSKATSFESLQVDQYVDDILQTTSSNIDQVTVEPDGAWSGPCDSDTVKLGGMTPASDDDEDDLIEISEPGVPSVKQEPGPANFALQRTPAQSREASTPSSVARMSSKKRPASMVIDLTESGDEDDEFPVPSPKRLAPSMPSRSFPRQDYHLPSASSPLNGSSYPPSI
ncbi:hypothetical protein PENANT_c008G08484 [Penicillium antarcticum]|uniref:PINIT domain-containing protein n=1 Tax=Penicillium antarcticum TaxID=416450 RepID=A0A1V6QAL1_9EURO|nr:hypothetical protein PENANT_c008G08484 [Penicillium antarcticum]